MTTIRAQCANLCAAMRVQESKSCLFRSDVIGTVCRPRWIRGGRLWPLQYSHTNSPLHPGAESGHGEQMGRPKTTIDVVLFCDLRHLEKRITNFWGLSAKLTRFS